MSELEYSTDALNVKSAFLGVKAILYVEGEEDVLFWHGVLKHAAVAGVEIEAVGGAEQIDSYITRIEAGELAALAARDADFLGYSGALSENPRVIYTAGYSIENSLLTADVVTELVRSWCRTVSIEESTCRAWLEELAQAMAPLVHLDIANRVSGTGAVTVGDSCDRFMTSNTSSRFCPSRIAARAAEAGQSVAREQVELVESRVGKAVDRLLDLVRGHFLASAVRRFIRSLARSLGRSVTIPADSLFVAALPQFEKLLPNEHRHAAHYLSSVKAAFAAI